MWRIVKNRYIIINSNLYGPPFIVIISMGVCGSRKTDLWWPYQITLKTRAARWTVAPQLILNCGCTYMSDECFYVIIGASYNSPSRKQLFPVQNMAEIRPVTKHASKPSNTFQLDSHERISQHGDLSSRSTTTRAISLPSARTLTATIYQYRHRKPQRDGLFA